MSWIRSSDIRQVQPPRLHAPTYRHRFTADVPTQRIPDFPKDDEVSDWASILSKEF
jgi:hypothetical protein